MFSFFKKSGEPDQPAAEAVPSWRERLFRGLSRTRAQWGGKLKSLFSRGKVDDELLEEVRARVVTAPVFSSIARITPLPVSAT